MPVVMMVTTQMVVYHKANTYNVPQSSLIVTSEPLSCNDGNWIFTFSQFCIRMVNYATVIKCKYAVFKCNSCAEFILYTLNSIYYIQVCWLKYHWLQRSVPICGVSWFCGSQ